MDVLSSQANLAGYKAVLLAANEYSRPFQMFMTSAGMDKPAKVVILGVGVAALQAIATAKRLGPVAEADVPYDDILEMDEINSDFACTDVVLVIGANDVVNPSAKDDPTSPVFGMPILEVTKVQTIMVIKRSMNMGYAGLDNSLFYMDKTMVIFGDANKMVEEMVRGINGAGH